MQMMGDPAFLFTQLTAHMKYKNEINYNSHSLNIIHTMTKDSIRTKCTTAYVARNHLYLSAA
jgi:hypothetical protein